MLVARRFLHSSVPRFLAQSAVASNSPLSVLRKKTGYSLSHCRTALQQFNDNLEQAEIWLHQRAQAEGWSRATKLQSRTASQGLIGLLTNDNSAAMVEINCETDFVGKNDKFQQLVSQVTNSLLSIQSELTNDKTFFDKETLSTLTNSDDRSKTLADLTALCIGAVGENVVLRRGVIFKLKPDQLLSSYCHGQINSGSPDACRMGKYGALVNYSSIDSTVNDQQEENSSAMSSALLTCSYPLRTICQHEASKPIELSTYFDHEDETSQLHEYLNGSIYGLPVRESALDLLLKNITTQIEQQQLKNVYVLPLDMRVQTPEPTYIYYPGLCLSHRAPQLDQAVTREPIVIIELITPTTERLILHEKSMNYQRIPSLKEIIYIWPNLKLVQVNFRDGDSSTWTRKSYGIEDKIPFPPSFGQGELVLAEIFHNMTHQFGRLLAQHIVATRSRTIGSSEKKSIGHDEDRLLYQKWMHTDDKKKTVQVFLNENQLHVNDFVRFECGEEI